MELSSRAYGHALNLQFGINAYLRRVSGLRAFFDTSGNVSRAQFEKITKQLMNDQTTGYFSPIQPDSTRAAVS